MKRAIDSFFRQIGADFMDAFWVYSRIPYTKGRMQARRDIRSGIKALKTFGKPARWRDTYAQLLENESGVRLTPVSDDFVDTRLREEIRGYNSVVKEFLREEHGRDFLEALVDRAKDQFTKQQRESGA